ncbi:MAG: hypothetical protein ABEJ93_03540 [Candidatus Nanohalobium sp.]
MNYRFLSLLIAVLVLSTGTGYILGLPSPDKKRQKVFQANSSVNASNPVTTAAFDNKSVDLVAQGSGKTVEFYINNGERIVKLEGLERDGEIHELKRIFTVEKEMYLFNMSYRDSNKTEGDQFLKLHSVRKL